jgi:hypothetical protein
MDASTNPNRYRERLVLETFQGPLPDEDALLLMTLLHMYRIVLAPRVSGDRPLSSRLDGATQRRTALAVAALWRERRDERSDYFDWYWKWNTEWGGYQHLENLSLHEIDRLNALKQRLEGHPGPSPCAVSEARGARPLTTGWRMYEGRGGTSKGWWP